MAIALHHSRAKGTARTILIGIANHCGDGGAWPAMATLAKYGNCNVRNARQAVARLEELGEIRRHVGAGGNESTADHMRPNLYQFTLVCPSTCDGTSRHRPRNSVTFDMEQLDPRSLATPPVASDLRPLSLATSEPPTNPNTPTDSEETYVGNRAREAHSDASGAAPSGEAFDLAASLEAATAKSAPQPTYEPCPKGRGIRPHSYAPASGECIDCGAVDPARINPETGEIA